MKKNIGSIIFIILIILTTFVVDIDTLREVVMSAGVWAPLFFIMLKIATIVVAPLSGVALYPLVGVLFGFWPGMLYVIIGDFLGYSSAFLLSRHFGRKFVEKIISKNENGIVAKLVRRIGTAKGFFITCIVGFAASDVLSYAAGLTALSYWKFIMILLPLSVAGTSIFVFFGSSLATISHHPYSVYAIPALVFVVIAVGIFLLSRMSDRSH